MKSRIGMLLPWSGLKMDAYMALSGLVLGLARLQLGVPFVKFSIWGFLVLCALATCFAENRGILMIHDLLTSPAAVQEKCTEYRY